MSDNNMSEPGKTTVNWEKYTALSSMLIAVCALVISIWQSYSIQQHNKLSLRPYLQQVLNTNSNGSWDIYIYNQGMGPAQVVGLHVKVDGIKMPDFDSFFDALGEDQSCYNTGHIARFYKVGDEQMVLATKNKSCFKSLEEIYEMLSRVELVLEYQSLYGESYRLVIGGQPFDG